MLLPPSLRGRRHLNEGGCRKISKLASNSVLFRVSSIDELKVIIDHFDRYPLISYKYKDYLLFKQAFELVQKKNIFLLKVKKKIVAIKASINLKLSSNLKNAMLRTKYSTCYYT